MNEHQTTQHLEAKKHKGTMMFLIVLLLLVALGALVYAVYAWKQNADQQASLSTKDAQIKSLNGQISSLKSASMVSTTPANLNTIDIRELGISITVPDSIKDLTYSYMPIANQNGKFEIVSFSTKSLSDQYATTDSSKDECTSYGSAPPLGALERWSGVYNPANPYQRLAKQLNGYYITYDSPQATCVTNFHPGANQMTAPLGAFTSSFASIKQL